LCLSHRRPHGYLKSPNHAASAYIDASTARAIWRYLATRPDARADDPLFVTQEGRPLTRDSLCHLIIRLGRRVLASPTPTPTASVTLSPSISSEMEATPTPCNAFWATAQWKWSKHTWPYPLKMTATTTAAPHLSPIGDFEPKSRPPGRLFSFSGTLMYSIV
jgi:hypothetical protein